MDTRLKERLDKWHAAIEELHLIEGKYLELDASEKAFFSTLFIKTQGKSVAEREHQTYASHEWKEFQAGLVHAKLEFNKAIRLLELKKQAFQAEYLTFKLEGDASRAPQ